MLLNVWREALAQVLADRSSEWEQTLRSIRSESRAAIAELRASIADVRSDIVQQVFEKVRQPADGAPALAESRDRLAGCLR
jgi:ElaB/YqjD/DUF883 family membrane-anchored ribosome-binding protein